MNFCLLYYECRELVCDKDKNQNFVFVSVCAIITLIN